MATLVISSYFIASFLFGHGQCDPCHFICWHCQWRPFHTHTYTHISFDFIALFLFGHGLWRLSFLFCHRIHMHLSVSISLHCVIPLGTACGDSVSVVRAPPVATLVISLCRFHRMISLGAACRYSVFCPVIEYS